jgi:menaquinol-cytochrome c reductase iron-sulfur subunit
MSDEAPDRSDKTLGGEPLAEATGDGDGDDLDRRTFLTRATLAIGGALAAAWTVPAAVYVLGPARRSDTSEQWVALGAANKVQPGSPTLFKATVTRSTGWVSTSEEVAVYVVTEDGRTFTGLSNVCTHLGCRVRWVGDQDRFFCPCHNATFDKGGSVLDGPPPKPLDTYELRVENGQIQVKLEV